MVGFFCWIINKISMETKNKNDIYNYNIVNWCIIFIENYHMIR